MLLNNNSESFFWKASGGAVIGRAHEKRGITCQDKIAYGLKNGIRVIALSDGAGSSIYSHIGAEVANKTITDYLFRNFEKIYNSEAEHVAGTVINKVLLAINKEKEKIEGSILEDFSATLLFIAVYKNKFIAGHIGDGVIAYTTKDSTAKVLSVPNNGEYANQTYFVTSKQSENMLKLFRGKTTNINSFMLMSDGAATSFYNNRNQTLTSGVLTLSKWIREKSEEEAKKTIDKNLEELIKMKTFDDCSLVVTSKITVDNINLENMDETFHKSFLEVQTTKEVNECLMVYSELKNFNIVKNSSYKIISKSLGLNKKKVRAIMKRLKRNGYLK